MALGMGSEDNGVSSLGEQGSHPGVDWAGDRGGGWRGTTGWRRGSPERAATCAQSLGWAVGRVERLC